MSEIDADNKFWIYCLYILSAVIWTFLVLLLRLYNGPAFFMVFIPYIVFCINVLNVERLGEGEDVVLFTGTFLSIGLIVMVAILGWFKNMGDLTKKEMTLLLLSLGLALFSHIELGFPLKYSSIYRNYRSILQTFSIVLFLIVLVNYFMKEDEVKT